MSLHSRHSAAQEIPASALLADCRVLRHEFPSTCHQFKLSPHDGIDVLIWKGHFHQPVEAVLRDDSDRIHFSYSLHGRSQSWFEEGIGGQESVLHEGAGSVNFRPGRRGRFRQHGVFESVTVMIRPDLFAVWLAQDGSADAALVRAIGSGDCLAQFPGGTELRKTARLLGWALDAASTHPGAEGRRSTLWMLGQSLAMAGLILEAYRDAACHPSHGLSQADRQKLHLARDRLLADLSAAPTLIELSREVGLSVLKLKRGFWCLFDNSVYGLFQQERMHKAHRRLCTRDVSVTLVAAEFGYTNASHFAAAFHKQFGINPSALKRR